MQMQDQAHTPDEGDEEPDVSFCQAVASNVALIGQNALTPLQGLKHIPATHIWGLDHGGTCVCAHAFMCEACVFANVNASVPVRALAG